MQGCLSCLVICLLGHLSTVLFQDHCLLEIQGRGQHPQGIQAQPPDCHRIQGPSFNPQLLLQIHLLQKGRTDPPDVLTFSQIGTIISKVQFHGIDVHSTKVAIYRGNQNKIRKIFWLNSDCTLTDWINNRLNVYLANTKNVIVTLCQGYQLWNFHEMKYHY